MKIAIVEDNLKWMDKIWDSVNSFFQSRQIEAEIEKYYDAESFLNAEKEYEIIYLDIELSDESGTGGMDGIEALQRYKRIFPDTIAAIVTIHEKWVRRGYFVGAYRYIYKKNLKEEIQEMLRSAMFQLCMSRKIRFYVLGEEEIEIACKDVIYVETYKRNVIVHTTKGNYINNKTLTEWKQLLGEENCCTHHKSYLLNLRWVDRIDGKDAVLYNGDRILLNVKRKKELQIRLMEWRLGEKNE